MGSFGKWLYEVVFGRPPLQVGERWIVRLNSGGRRREVTIDMIDGKYVKLRSKSGRPLGWYRAYYTHWERKVVLNR